MLVHRCNRCGVYKKEIQPCRAKNRGIWAILMHKMMFPSESCNTVLHSANSVRFPLSRTFSPRVPPEPLGVRVPQFGNRCCTAGVFNWSSPRDHHSDQKVIRGPLMCQ